MKKILFLLVVLLCTNAMAQTNQTDKQGRRQGVWEKFDKNGKKVYTGEFKDGYEIGDFIYYYPSGAKKTILSYSNNGVNAIAKVYNEDGTLLSEGNYKNKKKDGLWVLYTKNKEKVAEERYLNGAKDGEWIAYNNEKIVEKETWKNNKRDGVWYRAFADGYLQSNYKNDTLEGVYEEYFTDGKPILKGLYVKGEKTGEWNYFDEAGNKIKIENWKKDVLSSSKILLKIADAEKYQLVDSMAYFYMNGKGAEIVTLNGTKIQCKNSVDEIIQTLGSSNFMVINLEKKFYAKYNSIKKIDPSAESEDIMVVTLSPKTDYVVYTDKEATKIIKALFLNAPKK